MGSKELTIRYTGDASGVLAAQRQIEGAVAGLGDKLRATGQQMTSVGKSFTRGLTLPIVAGLAIATKGFADHQKVVAQTEAVIKSTGGAANVTAEQFEALANRLERLSVVDGDVIQSGANVLATFTNIRNVVGEGNNVFDQATLAALNLSVALDQDMSSSAVQLGKALNDPIRGVTALQRVGVSFTEAQREQIAAMVEAGDTMGAQKLILAELNTEFGGSAKAAGDVAGPMGQLMVTLRQIGDDVGAIVLPVIQGLSGGLQTVLGWFNQLDPGMKNIVVTLAAVAAAVGPVLVVLGKLVSAFGLVLNAVRVVTIALMANPYVLIAAATIAIAILIVKNWDTIKEFLKNVWQGIVDAAKFFWDHIAIFIIGPMKLVIDWLIDHWRGFKTVFLALWDAIRDGLKAILGPAIAIIKTIVSAIVGLIGWIKDAIEWLSRLHVPVIGGAGGQSRPPPQFGPPELAHGGIIRSPTLALLGEAGPEAVVPLGQAGIGTGMTVNVVVNGWIGSDQEIAGRIRDELIRLQRRNVSTGIV